jgi:Protein of unknown function (DUF3102)
MQKLLQFIKDRCDMRRRTTEEDIRLGLQVKAAKDALPHGMFAKYIEQTYGFHPTNAQRLMRIAKQAVIVYDAERRIQ